MDPRGICLPVELLRLQGSSMEHFFFTMLFPPLCIIGVVGNCLNLTVLLDNGHSGGGSGRDGGGGGKTIRYVRHRSNGLLISLAICDILFLLLMLPHSLANFDFFGLNMTFRLLYLSFKTHLISLANWCSAAAIWLVIAICAERLLGISSHFQSSFLTHRVSCCSVGRLISLIAISSFITTSYNHFVYDCRMKLFCNGTQVISICLDVVQESWPSNQTNTTPEAVRLFVQWSQIVNAALVIVLPIILMLVLNIALLVVVRRQSFIMYSRLHSASLISTTTMASERGDLFGGGGGGRRCSNGLPAALEAVMGHGRRRVSLGVLDEHPTKVHQKCTSNQAPLPYHHHRHQFRRSIDQTIQLQAEHRAAKTICAIVTAFTLTQGPSAVILSISFLSGHKPPFVNSNHLWHHANSLTGFLVVVGKTLNFLLFCTHSAAFRRRLVRILHSRLSLLWGRGRPPSFVAGTSATTMCDKQEAVVGVSGSGGHPQHQSLRKSQERRLDERKFSLAT